MNAIRYPQVYTHVHSCFYRVRGRMGTEEKGTEIKEGGKGGNEVGRETASF